MKRFFLPLILLVAFLLRFISLSSFPVGFNADEASFGYDAYSLLHTGKDQWGSFLPLALKSFGDYKSPVYGYLTVPVVAIFGLTPFATRLPNVIVGTLAVLFVYLLLKEVLNIYKSSLPIENKSLSLIAALLLALNPWHIMMSRGAFEANLVTFFIPAGVYFFIKGLKNTKVLIWSAIFLGLSLFTYHSAKLITPLVIVGMLIIFYKEIKKIQFKKLLPFILILLIFIVGLVFSFKTGGGSRISERSITQGALEEGAEIKIKLIENGENPIKARILHNKYQVMASRFINNYSQYFSFKFLFNQGAAESYYGMIPGIGVIFIFEGILLMGLIPLIFDKKFRLLTLMFIVWLLISILPAAMATGTGFSANRAEGMLPVLQILAALGIGGWLLILNKINKKVTTVIIIIFLITSIYQICNFVKVYFGNHTAGVYNSMLYGNLELAGWLNQNREGKDVILSRSLSEPHIFIAFSNKWSPSDYQNNTPLWGFDKSNVAWVDQLPKYKLGNYLIKSINWKVDSMVSNTIIVGRPEDLPQGIVPKKVFYLPDGTPNIFVVDTNQQSYVQIN